MHLFCCMSTYPRVYSCMHAHCLRLCFVLLFLFFVLWVWRALWFVCMTCLFVVVMGERKVLRVSGSHGGNLWMMVSPTVTERGSVFHVGRLSQSLSRSLSLSLSLSRSCPRFRPRMHTHTHTTRSLSHTPHAAGSGSMATCDTGTSLCRHRHIISRYTRVLVWSGLELCCVLCCE